MTTIELLDGFSRFTQQIFQQEGKELPLDVIFDRWHAMFYAEDDLLRIKSSVSDFEKGQRGRPVQYFLCELKSKQALTITSAKQHQYLGDQEYGQ